jgi:addiction module RelE/StbE family toxin
LAQIVYSANSLDDLERAFGYLTEFNPDVAASAASTVRQAVEVLADHPLIGHRVEGELRELVISYGKTGYVALYRFLPAQDQIRILAVRHQRELDYPD